VAFFFLNIPVPVSSFCGWDWFVYKFVMFWFLGEEIEDDEVYWLEVDVFEEVKLVVFDDGWFMLLNG